MGFTKKLHAESMERKAEREKQQAEYLLRKDVKERLEFEFLTAAAADQYSILSGFEPSTLRHFKIFEQVFHPRVG